MDIAAHIVDALLGLIHSAVLLVGWNLLNRAARLDRPIPFNLSTVVAVAIIGLALKNLLSA